MSEIDLNKAKAGDRFEDGRGNVMRYVGRYVGGDHTLQSVDKGLTWLYSDFGHCFYSADYDLIRALLTEMPIEPQEDPSAKPTLLESLPVYSIPIPPTEGETATETAEAGDLRRFLRCDVLDLDRSAIFDGNPSFLKPQDVWCHPNEAREIIAFFESALAEAENLHGQE
jgi:hypothetical protein